MRSYPLPLEALKDPKGFAWGAHPHGGRGGAGRRAGARAPRAPLAGRAGQVVVQEVVHLVGLLVAVKILLLAPRRPRRRRRRARALQVLVLQAWRPAPSSFRQMLGSGNRGLEQVPVATRAPSRSSSSKPGAPRPRLRLMLRAGHLHSPCRGTSASASAEVPHALRTAQTSPCDPHSRISTLQLSGPACWVTADTYSEACFAQGKESLSHRF